MKLAVAVLFLVGITLASPLSAQSLGDLAKKTAADREKAKATAATTDPKDAKPAPKTTFTDDDLKTLTPMPGGVTPPIESTDTAAPAATAPEPTAAPAPSLTPTSHDQEYWAGRMRTLTTQLDTDAIALAAADRRAARGRIDVDASNDGRGYVDRQLQQRYLDARDEASRVKAAVDADKAAIAALEEEARKANVPPGWLRR